MSFYDVIMKTALGLFHTICSKCWSTTGVSKGRVTGVRGFVWPQAHPPIGQGQQSTERECAKNQILTLLSVADFHHDLTCVNMCVCMVKYVQKCELHFFSWCVEKVENQNGGDSAYQRRTLPAINPTGQKLKWLAWQRLLEIHSHMELMLRASPLS